MFATCSDLKDLYEKVVPQLSCFQTSMEQFSKEHKQFEEMVKRYDEVIAQKANKLSIIETEKKCYEKFARKDAVSDNKKDHEERLGS